MFICGLLVEKFVLKYWEMLSEEGQSEGKTRFHPANTWEEKLEGRREKVLRR